MDEKMIYSCIVLLFGLVHSQKMTQCVNNKNITLKCNYIPSKVPNGIFKVQIADFVQKAPNRVEEVKKSNFDPDGWRHVTHLEILSDNNDTTLKFTANCFENLKTLKQLEMHISHGFELDSDAFTGLDNVTTLDMSNCGSLTLDELLSALDTEHKLPNLEKLCISKISYRRGGITLGGWDDWGPEYQRTISLFANHKLKVFEVYGTQIDNIRPTIFGYSKALEVLNLSYSNIVYIIGELPNFEDFARIKTIDVSFVVVPLLLPLPVGKLEFSNNQFDVNFADEHMLFFAPQTVNISGTVPKNVNSLWIKNCTARLKEDTVRAHTLISKENNLKYFDLHMDCEKVSFNSVISLDLSVNGLQFLHPSVLSCLPNMAHLDLSRNELNVMAAIDYRQFQDIFIGLEYLQEINLSANNLITTPRNLFRNNHNLEIIDLSYNGLTQITFTLEHAYRLRTLLLHNNHIQVLDSKSISSLTNVPTAPISRKNIHNVPMPRENATNITVAFYNNPLRCSQCENKAFLQWLLTTERVYVKHEHLACYATESVILDMNNAVIDHVEAICQRERVIVATTVSVATAFLLILALVIVKYLRKRHNERKNNIKKVIRLLKQGNNQYEFAVFLSYSSADDEFVRTCVLKQLGDILKEITGIDRTLICEGDLNLRPGFYVLDETIVCIQRSAVVIVVVSNHFCQSNYCDTELLQAYDLKKPILLIFKGTVEEIAMRPVMKLLFQRNVRVLFEEINGEYILKNTWEHVGKSIIDLIVHHL